MMASPTTAVDEMALAAVLTRTGPLPFLTAAITLVHRFLEDGAKGKIRALLSAAEASAAAVAARGGAAEAAEREAAAKTRAADAASEASAGEGAAVAAESGATDSLTPKALIHDACAIFNTPAPIQPPLRPEQSRRRKARHRGRRGRAGRRSSGGEGRRVEFDRRRSKGEMEEGFSCCGDGRESWCGGDFQRRCAREGKCWLGPRRGDGPWRVCCYGSAIRRGGKREDESWQGSWQGEEIVDGFPSSTWEGWFQRGCWRRERLRERSWSEPDCDFECGVVRFRPSGRDKGWLGEEEHRRWRGLPRYWGREQGETRAKRRGSRGDGPGRKQGGNRVRSKEAFLGFCFRCRGRGHKEKDCPMVWVCKKSASNPSPDQATRLGEMRGESQMITEEEGLASEPRGCLAAPNLGFETNLESGVLGSTEEKEQLGILAVGVEAEAPPPIPNERLEEKDIGGESTEAPPSVATQDELEGLRKSEKYKILLDILRSEDIDASYLASKDSLSEEQIDITIAGARQILESGG